MSTRGPLPKEGAVRNRTHPRSEQKTRLRKSGPVEPPKLHDGLSMQTVAWWQTWLDSPQADTFLGTDWQRLLMLVPLVEQYWCEPSTSLMCEIRLNETRLGATVSDRLRVFEDTRGEAQADPDVEDQLRKRRESRHKRAVAE